jgi:hypothetical protein
MAFLADPREPARRVERSGFAVAELPLVERAADGAERRLARPGD